MLVLEPFPGKSAGALALVNFCHQKSATLHFLAAKEIPNLWTAPAPSFNTWASYFISPCIRFHIHKMGIITSVC